MRAGKEVNAGEVDGETTKGSSSEVLDAHKKVPEDEAMLSVLARGPMVTGGD